MADWEECELIAHAVSSLSGHGWLRANCPLCESTGKPDKKKSLGFNTRSGGWNCFKCGSKGRLPKKLLEITAFEGEAAPVERKSDPPPQMELPRGFCELYSDLGMTSILLEPARRYLFDRGVSPHIGKELGIGGVVSGFYAGRIVVPVRDEFGSLVGWVGRDWTGKHPRKYLYPKGFSRAHVFNVQALYEQTEIPLLVVEGVFDALPYYPSAIACLGKPTKAHLQRFSEAKRPMVVCLDGDAWEEGWILSMRLQFEGVRAGFVRIPPGEDPGSVGVAWLLEQAAKAV